MEKNIAEDKQKAEPKESTLEGKYANLKVGDTVQFGMYPQKSADPDDKSPIEWIVLDIEDGKALLHSKYGLFAKAFNDKFEITNWEACTLRTYLNTEFYADAFSEAEKKLIATTKVKADDNPANDTEDNIFLLSWLEAEKYFKDDSARMRYPTEYAKKHGTYVFDNGRCWWWVRSSGFSNRLTTFVNYFGSLYLYGLLVDFDFSAVCPALVLDIKCQRQ